MEDSETLELRRQRELRERLINFYLNQYNIIHQRIETQYQLLSEITTHINYLYDNNFPQQFSNRTNDNNIYSNTNSYFNSQLLPNLILHPRTRPINNIHMTDIFMDSINIPTQEQINLATSRLIFSQIENPINTSCPIRHQDFEPTDEVIQINICRHNFYPNEINQWFTINSKCPVCRLDIRNNTTLENQSSRNDIEVARLLLSLMNLPS